MGLFWNWSAVHLVKGFISLFNCRWKILICFLIFNTFCEKTCLNNFLQTLMGNWIPWLPSGMESQTIKVRILLLTNTLLAPFNVKFFFLCLQISHLAFKLRRSEAGNCDGKWWFHMQLSEIILGYKILINHNINQ